MISEVQTGEPRAPYFLPYQVRWLADSSRFRVWEKSRRIGATYVVAFECVRAAIPAVGAVESFFSSASLATAKEFIADCLVFARMYGVAAQELGELGFDEKKGVGAVGLKFENGKRIVALSRSPSGFRGRGRRGDRLVLDEFAFHPQDEEMWRAVVPAMTWGGSVSIVSSHSGVRGRFAELVEQARESSENPWSLHRTTIYDAVADGLADKVLGRSLSIDERNNWIEGLRSGCGDEVTWRREFCCDPTEAAGAWLSWELIGAAESDAAGDPDAYAGGVCFVGFDVARRRDWSVIWVVEAVGDVFWTREVISLKNVAFEEQLNHLRRVMKKFRVVRLSIDQTGMGEVIVEQAKSAFGAARVQGVVFSAATKRNLAILIKQNFESGSVRIPRDRTIRTSHAAIRRTVTKSGMPSFEAPRSHDSGHGDQFWAHALALYGSLAGSGPLRFDASRDRRWADSRSGLSGFGLGDRRGGRSLF